MLIVNHKMSESDKRRIKNFHFRKGVQHIEIIQGYYTAKELENIAKFMKHFPEGCFLIEKQSKVHATDLIGMNDYIIPSD